MNNFVKICLSVLFFLPAFLLFSQKTDTIYFLNGDKLTGELKRFEYGYFKFKTDAMSTINVKYDKIATIYSDKTFEIVLDDKSTIYGSFDTSNIAGTVYAIVINDRLLKYLSSIVEITPIKNKFWRRFSGEMDIGYSYTKSTTLSQGNFSASVNYRPVNYVHELAADGIVSKQKDEDRKRRSNTHYSLLRYFKKRWFAMGLVGTQQNSELGLNLRLQGIIGGGKDIIHTKSNQLYCVLGYSINEEWTEDTISKSFNAEAVFSTVYKLFLISNPKVSINTNFDAYPSFSVPGRWRLIYNFKTSAEIVNNLYFNVTLNYNLDTKPPENSSQTDFNVILSLGYSFN